jgi:hypothetical protein
VPIPEGMVLTDRIDFESLIHHLALLGVAALFLWGTAGAMSWAAGIATIAREPAIRFMAAIMVLLVPEVVYSDLKALLFRSITAEERLNLASDR